VKQRRDNRLALVVATLLTFAVIGFVIDRQGSRPATQMDDASAGDLRASFQVAVSLLNARQYEQAADAFHQVLMLQPEMPEANVNMGFSLIGLQRYELARQFFQTAADLRPAQRNAYYGLAVAHEGLGKLDEAVVAMRTYAHLTPENDPYLRKAESAIWEWEAELSGSVQ
jgi:tetratricopeptide (TPR) repeat protein